MKSSISKSPVKNRLRDPSDHSSTTTSCVTGLRFMLLVGGICSGIQTLRCLLEVLEERRTQPASDLVLWAVVDVAAHLWSNPLERVCVVREWGGREGEAETIGGIFNASTIDHLGDDIVHATDEGFAD